jgi:hypothetical protein
MTSGRRLMKAWGMRTPGRHPLIKDRMAFLYSLEETARPKPFVARPDLTHEFAAFRLCPKTPIDFDEDLWAQPHLSPLTPACFVGQFKAETDEEAIQCVCRSLRDLMCGVHPHTAEGWATHFPDCEVLVSPEPDPHLPVPGSIKVFAEIKQHTNRRSPEADA